MPVFVLWESEFPKHIESVTPFGLLSMTTFLLWVVAFTCGLSIELDGLANVIGYPPLTLSIDRRPSEWGLGWDLYKNLVVPVVGKGVASMSLTPAMYQWYTGFVTNDEQI